MKNLGLIIAGVVSLALFVVNTGLVRSGVSQGLDSRLALSINGWDLGSIGTGFLVLLTMHGRELFWGLVVAVMIFLGSRETRLLGVELAVLFVVGIIVGDVLKAVWFRPRPFETLPGIVTRVAFDFDSSYPSGHALIVSIGAAFSLVKFRKKWVAVLLTFEAGLVCYSRVYVGMHYPLDVLGSVFAGFAIVFFGVYLLEKYGSELGRMVDYVLGKFLGEGWVRI